MSVYFFTILNIELWHKVPGYYKFSFPDENEILSRFVLFNLYVFCHATFQSYAKARVPPPSDLEPLQVGPDLEPIKEEEDSPIQTPVKKADKPIQLTPYPRSKSPRHRTPDTRDGSRGESRQCDAVTVGLVCSEMVVGF